MFLYFIPTQTAASFRTSDVFRNRLADILKDDVAGIAAKDLKWGPAGKDVSGVLICLPPINGDGMAVRMKHDPDKQTWQLCDADSDHPYWMGYETAKPPQPEQLLRKRTVNGYDFSLGDNREYVCPIIRRMASQPMLPCAVKFDGREYVPEVRPEYHEIWQDSIGWAKSMTIHEQAVAAERCLALNYRVGPYELNVLNTFGTEDAIRDVILAALDEPFFLQCLKDEKKNPQIMAALDELERSMPGSKAAISSTDLPAVSSA